MPELYDTTYYAASLRRKLVRSIQLGPKYYMYDIPRYVLHRHSLGLPVWDYRVLLNPLREFTTRGSSRFVTPPHYDESLKLLADCGITMALPPARLRCLAGAWWATRQVPGNVIECGAYRGATSLLIALLGAQNGIAQTTFVLDTFAGYPPATKYDNTNRGGEFIPPSDQVRRIEDQARALGIRDRIRIEVGPFASSFARLCQEPLHFSFVHIDCNIFSSTLEACEFSHGRTSKGGIIVFDDYNGICDLGARLAVDVHLARNVTRIHTMSGPSCYIRV
jgi:hypothetical protein